MGSAHCQAETGVLPPIPYIAKILLFFYGAGTKRAPLAGRRARVQCADTQRAAHGGKQRHELVRGAATRSVGRGGERHPPQIAPCII